MLDLLAWLESSGLGRAMRESGPWTYAVVNLTHILGIGALFGAVLVLDLRLLGFRRAAALAPLADTAGPIAGAGLALAVTSGVALLSANGTEYAGNPFLVIKLVAVALGAANAVVLRRSWAWRARHDRHIPLRVMAGMSLLCWLTAIAAGRMIGYW